MNKILSDIINRRKMIYQRVVLGDSYYTHKAIAYDEVEDMIRKQFENVEDKKEIIKQLKEKIVAKKDNINEHQEIANARKEGYDEVLYYLDNYFSKFYTGIGNQNTPKEIQRLMTKVAQKLEKKGFVLRSGANKGGDRAFANKVNNKEIYLPFKDYNNSQSELYDLAQETFDITKDYNSEFNDLDKEQKKLLARANYELLGYSLFSPCKFLICWGSNKDRGGNKEKDIMTDIAYAISLAKDYDVPIFNLYNKNDKNRLIQWID